jgi:hypothetical protein
MFIISSKAETVPLSVNIIGTRTNRLLLEAMLKSIAGIAQEIVIIADENADNAFFQTARRYTPRIYRYTMGQGSRKDFARQRNHALDHSTLPYVLWIDTDEVIRPSVAARIANLMQSPGRLSYYLWQVSRYGKKIVYVPQVRIFPRVTGVKWEIPIHEQILPSLVRAGIKSRMTDLRIDHLGYTRLSTVSAKNRRNLRILSRRVRQRPSDTFSRKNYQTAVSFETARRRNAPW